MTWFDLPALDGSPGGVLELPPEMTPPGLALELHVRPGPEGTVALWAFEDGRVLAAIVVVGMA